MAEQTAKPRPGVPQVGDPFLFGVNYWPRRKAMYWWKDFDAAEVREEFALIRDVGIGYVRFFMLWEDFQPTPETVSPEALKNLHTVADIAAEFGLKLEPTLFTGHMSGPNWAPTWLMSDKPAVPGWRPVISGGAVDPRQIYNVYVTPWVVEAEERMVRAIVSELKGHPAVWAYSLGNEPDLFCHPPTHEDGKAWVKRIVDVIQDVEPDRPVTIGLHTASIEGEVGLRVNDLAEVTDFSVMHGYSIYAPWAKTPLDTDVVPFANALTAALAGRPCLFEEYGLCTAWPGQPSHYEEYPRIGQMTKQYFPSEEAGAEYYYHVMRKLHKTGALGAFGWCFADYVESLWDKPPCNEFIHERFFGLVRPDGSLKEIAKVIREFAATKPVIQPQSHKLDLGVTPEGYYANPGGNLRRLFKGFSVE